MHNKESILQQIAANHSIIESHLPKNNSLLGGTLGLCMYYYTRYQLWRSKEDADKAVDLVATVLQDLERNPIWGYNYSSGAAGLGYMLQLLCKADMVDMDMDTEYGDMDAFIYTAALKDITHAHNHDYLHGAMGAVYYFLSRLPNAPIEKYVTHLLEAFCNKAVPTTTGIWFKNVVIPTDDETEINLSLAHGQASFLQLLIQASTLGIKVANMDAVITKGLQFINSVQQPVDFEKELYSYYPATIAPGEEKPMRESYRFITTYSRIAWCYGDLGILSTYYQAAAYMPKLWGNNLQLQKLHTMGTVTTLRKTEHTTSISDSNLCHGSSGVAQYYKYLYKLTGLATYKEASTYWLQKTLELLPQDIEKGIYKGKETDMLDGLVGVSLVLMDSIADIELDWSKGLLMG
jgi:lantibiotic biosynthesis protein